MLSITTDMAVPNDIDRLEWSIRLDGETTPYAARAVTLAEGTDLPVTLAIEAGSKTRLPITVRVEGRKGDERSSLLKVSREVKLSVPHDRVAKLDLPLSWLCSVANLTEPCEAGTTCQAGHCVDATVATAGLPEFQATAARTCYDVAACLPRDRTTLTPVGPIKLKSGKQVACGIAGATLLGADANVNVAFEVSNERVGNYGFCGPFGECFIPLHRGEAPESWHALENGETPAIELPRAICENSKTSVGRVALVQATASCPSDRGDRPLCSPQEAQGCLPSPTVCPAELPKDDWVGYACTEASPTTDHPELLKCWSPAAPDAEGHAPSDGRWCCLKGQEASDDPLLIDDMRDGPQVKRAPGADEFAGWWFTSIPEGSGNLVPPPEPSLYTYRHFDKPVGPPGGPEFSAAACLSSSGFRGWQAIQGFYFASKRDAYGEVAVDVSKYEGISFWGWAHEPFPDDPLPVEVNFPNVQSSFEPSAECITAADGPSRCESYFHEVSLTSEWKHYFVRWEDLAQSEMDWGQFRFGAFKPQIYEVYFGVRGAGQKIMSQPFEFCVADIRFELPEESRP
jgi:hypothetical protein